jgi:hypothetical protein
VVRINPVLYWQKELLVDLTAASVLDSGKAQDLFAALLKLRVVL